MNSNYKWYCDEINQKPGWNHPGLDKFIPKSGVRITSVVRESIQNSIDAKPKGSKKPCMVEFEYLKDCDISMIPSFDKYEIYCRSSLKYNMERNKNNTQMIQDMKATLDVLDKCVKTGKVDVIRIGDYNTVGLEHVNKNDERFDTILSAEGSSVYQGEAGGGTFGFGKYASFTLSQLRTVIYSTHNIQDEYGFAAKVIMGSFPISGGDKHNSNINKFVNEKNKAIDTTQDIKKYVAIRKEKGTDIYIIAPRKDSSFNSKNFISTVIKEVSENYFLSIYDKELICKVKNGNNEKIVDHKSIQYILKDNYIKYSKKSDDKTYHSDLAKVIQGHKPSSMFFLDAYTSGKTKEVSCKQFKKIKLYVLIDPKDHNDQIIDAQHAMWMRKLKMKVKLDSKIRRKDKPYVALILVTDKDGNKFMASMENGAHDDLTPLRLSGENQDKAKKSMSKVYDELDSFLEELRDESGESSLISETDFWTTAYPGESPSGSKNPLRIEYKASSSNKFKERKQKKQDPFHVLKKDINGKIKEPGPDPDPDPEPKPTPPKPAHSYSLTRGKIDKMRVLHKKENTYKVIAIFNEDLDEARFVCYASSDNNEKERRVGIEKAFSDVQEFRVTTNTFLAKNISKGKNTFNIEIDQNVKIAPQLWMIDNEELENE